MKNNIINTLMNKTARTRLKIVKHSPKITLGLGVVGFVGTTVLACIATTKISDILDEKKELIDTVDKAMTDEDILDYSEGDAKKDTYIIRIQTAIKIGKLYIPAVLLGVISTVLLVQSHNILNSRNANLAAAYIAMDKGYKEYRKRIIERFGEEVDRDICYGIRTRSEEFTTIDKKGKEKTSTEEVKVVGDIIPSVYARFFDESCPDWRKNADMNLTFLHAQQRYANDLLRARGHVFLNEIYDMLGFPRTKAGQCVGWVYDNPTSSGYIDFGIYSSTDAKRAFINGNEYNILLDFNVDGNILDLI